MARVNKKGRTKGSGRFTQLHWFMTDSAAWRSLSTQARSVYLEVARVYGGTNNGYLARSVRQLSELANINKDTASKCLRVLMERGFLVCTSPGGFNMKIRHAAEWRLTAFDCDRTGSSATKSFMKWRPEIQNAVPNEGRAVRNEGTAQG